MSIVEKIIIKQLNIPSNISIGLRYLIGELVDNITEHSESERGFIFVQSYPKDGFIDICIADKGITLLGSYKRMGNNTICSDTDAMKAANNGISTKNLPNAENRGYGIYTSKKMLVEGLGGHYLMISGTSVYLKSVSVDNIYELPENIKLNGTIVSMRFPYFVSGFDYVKYIE